MTVRGNARAGVGIAGLRLGNAMLGLGVSVALTRMLGAEAFGHYAYAVILLAIAAVPISNGWGMLVLRLASASRATQDWRETRGLVLRGAQYAVLIAISGGAAGLAMLWVRGEAAPLGALALALLMAVLLCDQLSALRMALLRGLNQQVLGQFPEMLVRPVILILMLLVADRWWPGSVGLDMAFAALACASAVALFVGAATLRRVAPAAMRTVPPLNADRRWFSAARTMSANAGLFIVSAFTDVLILGLLSTAADVGVYRVAAQVALFSNLAYTSINMVANQRFAFIWASTDRQRLQQEATSLARLAFGGNLTLSVGISAVAPPLVPMVFGPEFATAVPSLWVLAAAQVVNAAAGMPSALLTMTGHEAVVTRVIALTMLIGAVVCAVSVYSYGAIGAAWSTLLTVTISNLALWWTARRHIGVDSSIFARKAA